MGEMGWAEGLRARVAEARGSEKAGLAQAVAARG